MEILNLNNNDNNFKKYKKKYNIKKLFIKYFLSDILILK